MQFSSDPYLDAIVYLASLTDDKTEEFIACLKGHVKDGVVPSAWKNHLERTFSNLLNETGLSLSALWDGVEVKVVPRTALVYWFGVLEDQDDRPRIEIALASLLRETTVDDMAAFVHTVSIILANETFTGMDELKIRLVSFIGDVALSGSKSSVLLSERVQRWVDEGVPESLRLQLNLMRGGFNV